jgi:hypothetical protein
LQSIDKTAATTHCGSAFANYTIPKAGNQLVFKHTSLPGEPLPARPTNDRDPCAFYHDEIAFARTIPLLPW